MAIRVELELADGQFVTRMLHAGESVQRFNQNLLRAYPSLNQFAQGGVGVVTSIQRADQATQNFTGSLRQLAIVATAATATLGLGKILKEIVQVNSEFENMNMLMKSMSTAKNKELDAQTQVQALREEAMKAPFSLHALQQAAVKLSSVGLKPLDGSLRAVENAVAAVGGGDEKLERVTLAITQMSGKGVIQLEELRQQLGEALPQATQLMARSMGLTMAELLQKISTGTVAAKPALEGLFLEMERTFGGAAERMMMTFSGQITRTTALLQTLALRFGSVAQASGKDTFFGALKGQLNDLNNFLDSDYAGRVANSLNNILVSALNGARMIVDKFIEMRSFIYDVGRAAAIAFGFFLTGKLLAAVGSVVSSGVQGFKLWNAELSAVSAKLAIISAQRMAPAIAQQIGGMMGGFQINPAQQRAAVGLGLASSLGAAAAPMSLFGATAARVGAVLPALLSTAGSLVTILPLLGFAAYAVADYFDLFGNKARNAWEELQQFGATSMEQIVAAEGLMTTLEARLERLKKNDGKIISTGRGGIQVINYDDEIAALEAEIEQRRKDLGIYTEQAQNSEAERLKAKLLVPVNEALEAQRTVYTEAQVLEEKRYSDALEAAKKSHTDIEATKKDHEARLTDIAMKSYNDQVDFLNKTIQEYQNQISTATDTDKAALQLMIDDLNKRLADALSARNRMREQGIGVTTLSPAMDFDKLKEKGEKSLQDIRKQIQGMQFDMRGASREMGELEQAISSGQFGPAENAGIAELIDQLREAQSEADALSEALTAVNDSQGLYDSTMKALQDDHLNFLAEDKSKIEAYNIRQQAIANQVSPQGKIALMMQQIRVESDNTRQSVLDLGTAFTEKLFGTDAQNGGNTILSILNKMAQAVGAIVSDISNAQMPSSMGMSFNGGRDLSGVKSAVDLIKAFEGFISSPKWDMNAYRAGYGSDTTTNAAGQVSRIQPGMTVSLADADRDLFRRVAEFQQTVVDQIGGSTWGGLDEKTQQALTSVAYNYGSLPQNIVDAVKTGNKEAIAQSILARSTDNGGINASRRSAEANYMMSGNARPVEGVIYVKGANGEMLSPEQATAEVTKALSVQANDNIARFWKNIDQQIAELTAKAKDGSSAVEELKQRIREGEFGDSAADRDPTNVKYTKMYEAIEKVTEAQKRMKAQKEAANEVDNGIEENTKRLQDQKRALEQVDAEAKKNPYAKRTEDLQQIIDRYDILIAKAREANGGETNSASEQRLLAQKQAEIDLFNRRDVQATLNTLKQKEEALAGSLGNERQIRERELQRQLAELDAYKNNFVGSKEDEVLITAQVEKAKTALIQKYAQDNTSAFSQQMQSWADFQTNFTNVMTSAFSSLADGITSLIMGEEVDWEEMLRNVLNDLVNMGVQYLMSSMMGGKGQIAGGMKGMTGGKSISGMGGKGKMVPTNHTGGIVGRATNFKRVNPAAFAGARRFHSGGMVGGMSRRTAKDGLNPNEVPIIALRNEGVFTEEQMANMANALGYEGPVSPAGMSKHAQKLSASMKKMQKYHSGGIVGQGVDLGASRKDIGSSPIDARSLKAMEDNRQSNMAVTNNITVNGGNGGGDQKANQDLAKQISREVENSVRGIVYKEMRTQMRPGNMLGR